ncbi:MAG TPA: hypothetical protein VMI12_07575 [Puia sp.]|nr:hypothetical protein [Puia sp.]
MKLVQKIIITTVFNFLFLSAFSQNIQTAIKIQAMDMARALIKNDFNTFVEFMHPKIIAYAGGKEKLKKNMDSASQAMVQFGVEFKKIIIGDPGPIVSFQDQLQCVVPQTTTLQTLLGQIEAETSLLAISPDKGKKWYFIDTNVYKADKLKKILPDLSTALVIPPQKEPKFTPKQ